MQRRMLYGALSIPAALAAAAAVLAALLQSGYFRDRLIGYAADQTGRSIRVEGAMTVRVLTWHPRVTAERVQIGNPPWTPPGTTADIGSLSLVFAWPSFSHSFGVERLAMENVTLHLMRDPAGRANWQWTDPAVHSRKTYPIVRSLSLPDARVELQDDLRRLAFAGTVSARDTSMAGGAPPLRIEGGGVLNGRAAVFSVDAEPLATARHDQPYRFRFSEHSSGSVLEGAGSLPRPFDFDAIDATFHAAGLDLKDLFFLTGVPLVNTGEYRLSGSIVRRGTETRLLDLAATSGRTDMRGNVSVDSSSGRPRIEGELESKFLRLADLGLRAAGRAEPGPQWMLSDAALTPSAVRHGDAAVSYRAATVQVGDVQLSGLSARLRIDRGVLTVAPLQATVLDGHLTGHGTLDATTDHPVAAMELVVTGAQLARLPHTGLPDPPFDGPLSARVVLKGRGSSLHQIASSGNGTLTAVLSRGRIRTSLAELAVGDLRGLGAAIAKNPGQTTLRCGVANFEASDGVLTARRLMIDTDPVQITGTGMLHLDAETIDLLIRGHPKGPRLRVRTPLRLTGTLAHPSIAPEPGVALAQTAAAVALGVVLTPLASVLAFVDPGLAKDADCASLGP